MRSSKSTFGIGAERVGWSLWSIVAGGLLLCPASRARDYRVYSGCCDGSAAAWINEAVFAASSDEQNVLRIYPRDSAGGPLAVVDLATFLGSGRRDEADLEGAARLGDLVFWIGSHSRNSDGKQRRSRHVLFATRVVGAGSTASLEPVGVPYRGLVAALEAASDLAPFDFTAAARRPPEDPGGLNIEGLSAGPDGSLWVGFRNPVPGRRALLVPILNPANVIRGETARLGAPLQLDLDGLGIRDMAKVGGRFLILGGPADGGGRHRLFLWDGSEQPPRELPGAIPKRFQAEGLVVADRPDAAFADLLADEGNERIGDTQCKEIDDPVQRVFRALRVKF